MAGTLSGKVMDIRNMQPISGAAVDAEPGGHKTTSGDEGTWTMSVPADTDPGYSLTITKEGYSPWIAEGIVVLDDVDTDLPIVIHPSDM